jgi:hypothetical protein
MLYIIVSGAVRMLAWHCTQAVPVQRAAKKKYTRVRHILPYSQQLLINYSAQADA